MKNSTVKKESKKEFQKLPPTIKKGLLEGKSVPVFNITVGFFKPVEKDANPILGVKIPALDPEDPKTVVYTKIMDLIKDDIQKMDVEVFKTLKKALSRFPAEECENEGIERTLSNVPKHSGIEFCEYKCCVQMVDDGRGKWVVETAISPIGLVHDSSFYILNTIGTKMYTILHEAVGPQK